MPLFDHRAWSLWHKHTKQTNYNCHDEATFRLFGCVCHVNHLHTIAIICAANIYIYAYGTTWMIHEPIIWVNIIFDLIYYESVRWTKSSTSHRMKYHLDGMQWWWGKTSSDVIWKWIFVSALVSVTVHKDRLFISFQWAIEKAHEYGYGIGQLI